MQDATPSNDACIIPKRHKLVFGAVDRLAEFVGFDISEGSNVTNIVIRAAVIDTERVVVGTHASTSISKVTEKVDVEALFTVWRQSGEAASDICFNICGILLKVNDSSCCLACSWLQNTDGFDRERDLFLAKTLGAAICRALTVRAFLKTASSRGAKAAADRGDICCKNTLKGKGQECSRSNHF